MTPLFPIHLGAFLKMLRDRHGIAQAEVVKHLPGAENGQTDVGPAQ